MKKIIISTGGTGGHVIPAQVLYEYLDHKNLNLDIEDFKTINPSAENIAIIIYNKLIPHFDETGRRARDSFPDRRVIQGSDHW